MRSRDINGAREGLIGLLGSAMALFGPVPQASAADAFAASVLACAAESDNDRRLECYDRTVANYTAKLSEGKRDTRGGAAPVGSPPAPVDFPPAAIGSAPAPAGSASAPPRHVTAQVTAVDYFPDHIVVHLDNDQVWQQVSESSSDFKLRVGDAVTIDKQMGSYWLSGRKGGAIQVKLKAP